MEMLDGNARKAEREFGRGREAVNKGMKESESGERKKKTPDSEKDGREIAEPHSQVDPKFQGDFMYTRIAAEAVGKELTDSKGHEEEELPAVRTVLNVMNRLGGYALKKRVVR